MGGRHVDMNQHIGNTYNYLTVLSLDTDFYLNKGKSIKRTFFNCECICGSLKRINAAAVINATIKSCGCKKTKLTRAAIADYYTKKYKNPVEDKLFGNYKTQAKKHNREFTLELEEFQKIVNSNCFYCGSPPELVRGNKTKSVTKALNGIDRKDSSLGYVTENVVPCCPTCNKMKLDHATENFLSHIQKIINFQNENKFY